MGETEALTIFPNYKMSLEDKIISIGPKFSIQVYRANLR